MPERFIFHDERTQYEAIVVGLAIDFPSFRYAKKYGLRAFMDDTLANFPVLSGNAKIARQITRRALLRCAFNLLIQP
ncbi:MAG: hypothetical protein BMS9Abin15_1151 [Gammaproteobacteria bacterium]|nr:MAG: hypothetical protein BMS9Abin15_1151 [Gammaproteobacteria bacterium]